MEFISAKQFESNQILNKSERLFVSKWCEQFNWDTIDTYRVRLMNSVSILNELHTVIDDYLNESISIENIKMVCIETERILSNDSLLELLYPVEQKFTLRQVKNFDKNKISRLKADTNILKLILERNYKNDIISELTKNFKDSNSELGYVSFLTQSLGSYLLWEGYSYKYLYELKKIFLSGDSPDSFLKKFVLFAEKITNPKNKFTVYIKLTSRKDLINMGNIFDFSIQGSLNLGYDNENVKKFDKQSGNIYCCIPEIMAFDYISAIRIAKEKLAMFHNLIRWELRKTKLKISPKIMVIDEETNQFYLNHAEPRTIGFISSGSIGKLKYYTQNFDNAISINNKKLNSGSREKLSNSLRFFRMGLDADSTESKFIHTWIAIEYLLKTGEHGSIIGLIQQYLPKVIAIKYFSKILKNFSSDLKRINLIESIEKKFTISKECGKISLKSIFELLKNKSLVDFIDDNPLFVERVKNLSDMFNSNNLMKEDLHRHLNDLEWNLQRIYRLRNKIIHSAKTSTNILQLESNLAYYFSIIFEIVLYEAAHSDKKTTIEEILSNYVTKYEFLEHYLSNEEIEISNIIN